MSPNALGSSTRNTKSLDSVAERQDRHIDTSHPQEPLFRTHFLMQQTRTQSDRIFLDSTQQHPDRKNPRVIDEQGHRRGKAAAASTGGESTGVFRAS
jgi:hypothetical protein